MPPRFLSLYGGTVTIIHNGSSPSSSSTSLLYILYNLLASEREWGELSLHICSFKLILTYLSSNLPIPSPITLNPPNVYCPLSISLDIYLFYLFSIWWSISQVCFIYLLININFFCQCGLQRNRGTCFFGVSFYFMFTHTNCLI